MKFKIDNCPICDRKLLGDRNNQVFTCPDLKNWLGSHYQVLFGTDGTRQIVVIEDFFIRTDLEENKTIIFKQRYVNNRYFRDKILAIPAIEYKDMDLYVNKIKSLMVFL